MADIEHWNRALEGRLTKKDWVDFFAGRGFRAGVDYPVSKYYRCVTTLKMPFDEKGKYLKDM